MIYNSDFESFYENKKIFNGQKNNFYFEKEIKGKNISIQTVSINKNHTIVSVCETILLSREKKVPVGYYYSSKYEEKIIDVISDKVFSLLDKLKIEIGITSIDIILKNDLVYFTEISLHPLNDHFNKVLLKSRNINLSSIYLDLVFFKNSYFEIKQKGEFDYVLLFNTKETMDLIKFYNSNLNYKIVQNNLEVIDNTIDTYSECSRFGYIIYKCISC